MKTLKDSAPLVEMRNISVAFGGVQAVDDVSIEMRPGEVLGLLGHNGAGKSTLISILAGANAKDSGEIIVAGKAVEISSPKAAKANGIETIYQNLALANNLDAVSNLFLGRELRRYGLFRRTTAMRKQAAGVFEQINPRFKNTTAPVGSLSGGQRQSIAIARAIYFKAKVLIMDEPTAALGPSETAMFKDVVLRLKESGVAIVLISHDMQEVFDLADRLVVMADGKVVGRLNTHEATKDEVLSMIIMGGASADPGAPADPDTASELFEVARETLDEAAAADREEGGEGADRNR